MPKKKEAPKKEAKKPKAKAPEAKKVVSAPKKLTQEEVDAIVDKVNGPIAKRQVLEELKFKKLV